MKKHNVRVMSSALVLAVIGCVSGSYRPPPGSRSTEQYTLVVNKPYNRAWTDLIDHTSSSFFAIKQFEKASGLLTLEFGSSQPREFVDCGRLDVTDISGSYSGRYIDFLEKFVGRTSLDGAINIFDRPVSTERTQIRVNARYILTSVPGKHWKDQVTRKWVFNTGGSDAQPAPEQIPNVDTMRRCQPTYKAEKAILSAVQSKR